MVITTVPYEEEMRIFYLVNKEAGNVPTDLTAELLEEIGTQKIAFGEKITAQHRRKTLTTYIAKRLAQEPGPWEGKIRCAGRVGGCAGDRAESGTPNGVCGMVSG